MANSGFDMFLPSGAVVFAGRQAADDLWQLRKYLPGLSIIYFS
jgi:hypothetical protein